ncbi:g2679 [Coccomyxa elongata]
MKTNAGTRLILALVLVYSSRAIGDDLQEHRESGSYQSDPGHYVQESNASPTAHDDSHRLYTVGTDAANNHPTGEQHSALQFSSVQAAEDRDGDIAGPGQASSAESDPQTCQSPTWANAGLEDTTGTSSCHDEGSNSAQPPDGTNCSRKSSANGRDGVLRPPPIRSGALPIWLSPTEVAIDGTVYVRLHALLAQMGASWYPGGIWEVELGRYGTYNVSITAVEYWLHRAAHAHQNPQELEAFPFDIYMELNKGGVDAAKAFMGLLVSLRPLSLYKDILCCHTAYTIEQLDRLASLVPGNNGTNYLINTVTKVCPVSSFKDCKGDKRPIAPPSILQRAYH